LPLTDAEARYLRSSMLQAFVNNLRSGRAGPLPRPVEELMLTLALASAEHSVAATGSPDTVRDGLARLIDRARTKSS
jgi:alkanesulfonate monooxygenase SsuD/methylene tetrahydromethanopterin reductase-like flavin-dependent oxidoreductase (luciferase family)